MLLHGPPTWWTLVKTSDVRHAVFVCGDRLHPPVRRVTTTQVDVNNVLPLCGCRVHPPDGHPGRPAAGYRSVRRLPHHRLAARHRPGSHAAPAHCEEAARRLVGAAEECSRRLVRLAVCLPCGARGRSVSLSFSLSSLSCLSLCVFVSVSVLLIVKKRQDGWWEQLKSAHDAWSGWLCVFLVGLAAG